MEKLVIVGAGGFGREVLFQILENNKKNNEYEILGFVDDSRFGETINSYKVIGTTDWLVNYSEEICAVICIGSSAVRKKVVQKLLENKNIKFPTIIADDVKFSDTVKFGKGCIICLSNILTVNITLGDFVISNLDCTIGHDAVLSDFTTLYPSVNISGNVTVGECTEIGTGSNIIQGKNIGHDTIIGAGSVVVKDIPDSCTAVGVPCSPIKYKD